jgi:hypothetical protein
MKVERISYQGVLSFLSLEGINHDTCDDDKANYTGATGTKNEENHHGYHDNMVTAANGKYEPHRDIPKTTSLQLVDSTTSTILLLSFCLQLFHQLRQLPAQQPA